MKAIHAIQQSIWIAALQYGGELFVADKKAPPVWAGLFIECVYRTNRFARTFISSVNTLPDTAIEDHGLCWRNARLLNIPGHGFHHRSLLWNTALIRHLRLEDLDTWPMSAKQ